MKTPIPIAATLLVSVLLGGCAKEAEKQTYPPRPVRTLLVAKPTTMIERRFSGQVQTSEGAGLAFESGGRVTKVLAKEGTRYQTGDLLAQVDESNYRSELLSARANLTNAQQELRRSQSLFETGNSSQSSLDAALANEVAARSSYELTEKALNDTKLLMPYDGVIGSVSVEPQQVVAAGQEVMTIQGEAGKEFEVGVPAEEVGKLTTGMEVKIRLGAIPELEIPASIIEISPQVSQNATYPVIFQLQADAGKDPNIKAGMDGESILSLPNPLGSAIRIPSECVAASSDGTTHVWVVTPIEGTKTATVMKQVVKTGALGPDGTIEVLEGLKPNERIVTRGLHSLDENMTVGLLP
ncbi:MAG: efflux RND transporter periplasmic adaptor subunit [Verrucomicrobiota bacterium]